MTLLGGAELPLASSSAATRSPAVIICPLAPGVIIPCCGPPIVRTVMSAPQPIDCCPTPRPCLSTVTIDSTPNPSMTDHGVVISGQVLGARTVGVPVVLWQRLPGESQFQQIATATTDASGKYTIKRTARHVDTDREWYVTVGAARSPTLSQGVAAVVALEATAGAHGSTIFAGHVSPAHRGERILLERRSAGGWITIARPRLSRRSSFHVGHRLGRGIVVLQAVLPPDSLNVRSASRTLTVHSRSRPVRSVRRTP